MVTRVTCRRQQLQAPLTPPACRRAERSIFWLTWNPSCLESSAWEECCWCVRKKRIETLHHSEAPLCLCPPTPAVFIPLLWASVSSRVRRNVSNRLPGLKTNDCGPSPVRFQFQLSCLWSHINRTMTIKTEAWRGPGRINDTFGLNDSRNYFSSPSEH